MESHGGETGGLTLTEAMGELESRGYGAQFAPREGGRLECLTCHTQHEPSAVDLDDMHRVEGVSDPDDMALVAALVCPVCDAHGTAAIGYGPHASAEEREVLVRLDDERLRHPGQDARAPSSDVPDSGWLDHPNR